MLSAIHYTPPNFLFVFWTVFLWNISIPERIFAQFCEFRPAISSKQHRQRYVKVLNDAVKVLSCCISIQSETVMIILVLKHFKQPASAQN